MTANQIDVSIVVPVYNSDSNIFELALQTVHAMNAFGLIYELILVDDCSIDNSWKVISDLCESNNQIRGIRLEKNCGQWCSTLAGMSRATGRYIVTIDDDLEYDPADIPVLYEYINQSTYEVVFGMAEEKYSLQGRSKQLSTWRNKLLNLIWNKAPTDSFKIVKRSVVFKGDIFLPKEHFESFIKRNLSRKFLGYTNVRFHRRYSGTTNYTLIKKIKLFFIFSRHYLYKNKSSLTFKVAEELN